MRNGFIALVACLMMSAAAGGQDRPPEMIVDADVVDMRDIWKGGDRLDRLVARAKGLDPDQIRVPRRVKYARPEYPTVAYRTGINGTVAIDCIIETTGEPKNCRVVSGPPELRDASLEAVRRWRWEPLQVSGTARRAAVQIRVGLSVH